MAHDGATEEFVASASAHSVLRAMAQLGPLDRRP